MSHVGTRAWKRFAALAMAGALAVVGLWLAVSAGASGGESVRKAGYPEPGDYYDTTIDNVRYGKIASTQSHRVRFKFHSKGNYYGDPDTNPSLKHRCKLDDRRYKNCESPKKYKHLNKGKHRFKVKLVYLPGGPGTNQREDVSQPAKHRWKVK
jgi:hypothetical protein